MKTELYSIDAASSVRLAIVPRPRGADWLEDEIKFWRSAGIDIIVSLLTQEEMDELDIAQEPTWCAANGMEFISFPILDRGVPDSTQQALELVRLIASRLSEGMFIAIHCRQGVGRSALMAACVLAALGDTPDTAFERIARARGCPVPDTSEQRDWVKNFVEGHLREPSIGGRSLP